MKTDSERLAWLLGHCFIGHDYGESYVDCEGFEVPGGMKRHNQWERACIKRDAAKQKSLLLAAIDAAMAAEEDKS